ncbi:ABC transporter substrate-binding protein [Candidatus Galacturonibacter soehngenii]|uniref:Carbohydrate ABC transporter substrate-binding protein n=1 Tax=Candidatus Galacturonatibacter soehngenii TaxID=2307010 RepID=A0A7V7UHP0_9FIRM|nr:carbohydrate ABC transporter substrate-binding protein [Candidatus Galacturonibacter soehngenii]
MMKKAKKLVALLMASTMALSLAACGSKTDSKTSDATTDTSKDAAADTSKDDAKDTATDSADGKTVITFSWWGGDSRHEATIAAVNKFMELNKDIEVKVNYGAWDGWEEKMATGFATGTGSDVTQINWNWLTSFSSDGNVFADLNEYKDIIDLTQFDQTKLDLCTVAGKLQAVPVSMTGRIFYWNKATFEKAGIAVPTSLEELKKAGETFKTKLGDDYYPLAMGELDRTILMVYYLESVYGKPWVEDNKLQYTEEEVQKGLEFIKSLEDSHVIPTIETITGDGADSLDKNPKWMNGIYAGIFEWDSSASKFESALEEGQEFVVGDYFKDMGEYQGGFSKVSLGFSIAESAANKEACAKLVNFLLNEEEGVKIMASERGIPLSKAGLQICTDNDLLNKTVAEANGKVLAWTQFALDPKFEDAKLKNNPDGVYYDVMQGLSYGDYDLATATTTLIDGINAVLGN